MIGLIFGDNGFPKKILKKIKKKNIKHTIIDLSKKNVFKNNKSSYSVSIGEFGKIINILKNNNCKKVLFAGRVSKPNFSKIKLDFKGIYYIPRIIKSAKIGDAAILKEVIKILKQEKIKTIDSLFYNPELTLKKGNHSKIRPNAQDNIDIRKGIDVLNKSNSQDFIQGVVVRDKKVIATEDSKGTQVMLQKCKKIKGIQKGVLVKFPKKKQDLRIDLPTIGMKTLIQCKLSGIKGIVLKSKKNIFLDIQRCINFANTNNIFITVK